MKSTQLEVNEIRDYIQRAPVPRRFDGRQIVYSTHARLVWLASMARGSIHERINRRAGIPDLWRPFVNPVFKAHERNRRRRMKIAGTPVLIHCI